MGDASASRSRANRFRIFVAVGATAVLAGGAAIGASAADASPTLASQLAARFPGYHIPATVSKTLYDQTRTSTPIKHLVVIFDENESFDHYFGTYPYAANTDGTPFVAKPGTPTVNGLYSEITSKGPIGPLLTDNPNEYDPQRLTSAEALTSDQNHDYVPEQLADDNNKQDAFVQNTESSTPSNGCGPEYCPPGIVMDYFDGNTVTGLWNYAQNYAMSDDDFDTAFGPSSPGAINVISGDTAGGYAVDANDTSTPGVKTTAAGEVSALGSDGTGTIYGDIDPFYDECSDSNHTTTSPEGVLTSPNIGDLLNSAHVTWGWFQGGFAPTSTDSGGAVCGAEHELTSNGQDVSEEVDYVPHHNPFEFNATTANPAHLPPSSLAEIGYTDQASHQYDMSYFADALNGTGGAMLPAVSYLKPPKYENAHPGNSDPLEEQQFVVSTINQIEQSKYWPSTAIIVTYDDSDGWYDHATPPVINGSSDSAVGDTAVCTSVPITVGSAEDRCGYGDRLPFLVISPYTRQNYVSGNLIDTASVVSFIEDNWLGGERIPGSFDAVSGSIDGPGALLDFNVRPHLTPVILNPTTGAVVSGDSWYGNQGKLK
ncbi:MAG TPA: alkaline phosphatase family protein [Streptosporangiaceae bacterium]|jgi:phospholipase C|nr:alkaline phosphatase family protein [Streptosporangiaceae bacterium]